MLITAPIAVSGNLDLISAFCLAALPIGIAFAFVLVSSVVVGIPVHVMLQKRRIASAGFYLVAGSVAGCLVPLVLSLAIGAVGSSGMAALGAFSGAMTARSWSKSLGLEGPPVQATG